MLIDLFLIGFATLMLFTFTFLLAVVRRDNGLVDIVWGLGFVFLTLLGLGYSQFGWRQFLLAVLITLWGSRLAVHIFLRNRGRGEDFRYRQWREDWGRWWVVRSFLQIYLLQWLLQLLVASPIFLAMLTPTTGLNFFDYLGVGIFTLGFYFEAVGDYQLTRFKKRKKPHPRLLTTGLWAWTRHPNYFGEAVLWWGIALIALAQTHNPLVFLGPLTINFLLLKISGIPLLEKKYQGREDWEKYVKKTPAFFPRPPRH